MDFHKLNNDSMNEIAAGVGDLKLEEATEEIKAKLEDKINAIAAVDSELESVKTLLQYLESCAAGKRMKLADEWVKQNAVEAENRMIAANADKTKLLNHRAQLLQQFVTAKEICLEEMRAGVLTIDNLNV